MSNCAQLWCLSWFTRDPYRTYTAYPRIANHLQSLLDSLNSDYKKLTDKEAEAITDADGSTLACTII